MPFRNAETGFGLLLSLPVAIGIGIGVALTLAFLFAWKAALTVTLGVVLFGVGYCCGNWERKP